ncbi:APC family permease [Sphingomonas nostoxanthinifaciens]|uniref:APC family permease n=1 Tax=Sphingomonas nostoxanthinifaciens TaxID=2872652 RepID=UPI001CC1FCFD|nr:APC family permease [Sphingomonas nostoxanthinifaciens]UAK22894.1 APC family permease [Sphingomonas nostoxanthinifaciens]
MRDPFSSVPLRRCLGTAGVLFLTLSVATPASSVFVIVPGMLQVAGTGALWALALAAIVCVATAFIYAELSSAWPAAGGEYVMVARTLGPLAGFVMLGINLFNNLLFPPVAALGIAAVAGAFWPGLPTVPVAVAAMAFATLLGILNVRVNALVTGIFLAIEGLTLAIVAALGLLHPGRAFDGMLLHPLMLAAGRLVPASAGAIGLATSIAIFALNGYGAAVYFGEEMHDAPRRIARTILLALAATLLLEGGPVIAGLIGARDLPGFLTANDPFGLLVRDYGGLGLARWVALGVDIAIVNAIIAGILATARFLYATGRDRAWGRRVDPWLAAVHPSFASPAKATLFAGAVGIGCCFVPLRFLLVLSGTGLIAIYAGIGLAVVRGRQSGATAHAQYRMPLFPLAPIVAGAALAYVTWLNWLDPDEGRPGLIVTGAQIVGSAAYYLLVLRRRGWTAGDAPT